MKTLTEGEDFFYDEKGFFVFTREYHLLRGYCCGYECRECPFDYEGVSEPRRSLILEERLREKNSGKNTPGVG